MPAPKFDPNQRERIVDREKDRDREKEKEKEKLSHHSYTQNSTSNTNQHTHHTKTEVIEGYVGFANLPNQVYRKSVKKGFEFTLMVVGELSIFINLL